MKRRLLSAVIWLFPSSNPGQIAAVHRHRRQRQLRRQQGESKGARGGSRGRKCRRGSGRENIYNCHRWQKDMSDPWCLRHREALTEYAKTTGHNCYVKARQTDSMSRSGGETLIRRDIDAICVVPIGRRRANRPARHAGKRSCGNYP